MVSIISPRSAVKRPAWALLLALLPLAVAGCSGGGSDSAPSTTSDTATTAPIEPTDTVPQEPAEGAEAAVRTVLEAEQAGDHARSFALLSDAGRRVYVDQADWVNRRNELAPITGFEIEEVNDAQVTVLVEHEPGLDPFLGLSAAQERQTWMAVEVGDGWLVDPDPETEFIVPADEDAQRVAVEWVTAVQACDEGAAAKLQALPTLFGAISDATEICSADGTPEAGPVQNLEAGPASADIVAQYSSDALIWGRTVPVAIAGISLEISLAPIGNAWKVMGVSD